MEKGRRRVLLIVPPTGLYLREDRCQTPIEEMKTIALRPPIDLMYCAAATEKAGCECRLVDYPAEQKTWINLETDLRDFQPDSLMISATTLSLARDLEAAALAKGLKSAILTVAKGAHFIPLDRETLQECPDLDCVIRGEYELTAYEIGLGRPLHEIAGVTWRKPGGTIERNPERPFIDDLDSFAFPARHLTDNSLYTRPDTLEPQTTVVTNRGCPHSCIYCLAPVVSGKKNRYRSTDNVISELEECVQRFGIRNFFFRSDLFTQNRKWVAELCEKIIHRGLDISWASNSRVDSITPDLLGSMKRAGCWVIAYGVESGSQEMLDHMQKNVTIDQTRQAIRMTREAGIKSSIYFLMGLPWDTPETLNENVRFANEIWADFVEVFYTYPFPGTKLCKLAVEHGLIAEGEIPSDAYSHPAMRGLYMSREELEQWRCRMLRQVYLRPGYILHTLCSIGSPREFAQYMKLGLQTLKILFHLGSPAGAPSRIE